MLPVFLQQAPLCTLEDGELPDSLKQRLEDETTSYAGEMAEKMFAKILSLIKVSEGSARAVCIR